MKAKTMQDVRRNEAVTKRLAKVLALQCFRNTELENLHAGISPSSKAGDFSDVKVISPFGEIPWKKLSRLNDEEMKTLMIDVVNHTYRFLFVLFNSSKGDDLIELLKKKDLVPDWNDPV